MGVSGFFVSFEGGDAAGKTTQIALLAQWLRSQTDHEVVCTREPGGTELGQQLRDLVLHGGDIAPRAEALLYAADRAHHVETVIRPALADGSIVLTDRFLDSSVAYQGVGRELSAEAVEKLNLWATQDLLPSVTYLLDIDPSTVAGRFDRGLDRLERAGADFHQRTRQAFLDRAAADPQRWVIVDASRSIEQIAADIQADIAPKLASAHLLTDQGVL